jgi:ABC-2 type transport system ATP-binding protein
MRVEECVADYLLARGVPSREARWRTVEILERFGMGDRRQDLVRELSGGLGQRVLLAMAFASGADLLMLDEPTAGLDPVARRQTWELLVAQKARGTILLTTHSMSEAEALADRVAILSGGRIIACDTPEMLRRRLPSAEKLIVEARLDTTAIDSLATFEPYAGKLALYPRDREALRQLMEITLAAGVEASLRHTTLEDVYVRLVGGAPGLAEGELQ